MPSTLKSKEFPTRRRSSRLATIVRTKENVVVFKVFIDSLDEQITAKTLFQQLSEFGKIQDFCIVRKHVKGVCKITYFDPKSAATLLRSRFIRLNRTRYMIKPSPTWEQPLQVINYNEYESASNEPQYTEDILKLNDYCLATIFEYLDINSQLRFSFCHERLEDIYINMVCPRSTPKQLILDEFNNGKFSDWEIWQFFKTAGQYIEAVKMTDKYDFGDKKIKINILGMVKEFCTNVQCAQFIKREFFSVVMLNFINVRFLTEIELYSCEILDWEFHLMESKINYNNVTSLGLAENAKMVGDILPKFKNLQRLSLYNCINVTNQNLIETFKNINLKYLDIRSIGAQPNRYEILKYCPNLETLKMSVVFNKDLEHIQPLENLKSLEIMDCRIATASCVTALFEKNYNNLQTLKLTRYGSNILPCTLDKFESLRTLWLSITNALEAPLIMKAISTLKELEELKIEFAYSVDSSQLLDVVKKCLKLKRLWISDCKNVKKDFIDACCELLENRYSSSAAGSFKPLKIFLSGSGLYYYSTSKFVTVKSFYVPLLGLLSNDLPLDVQPSDIDDNSDYYIYNSYFRRFYYGDGDDD